MNFSLYVALVPLSFLVELEDLDSPLINIVGNCSLITLSVKSSNGWTKLFNVN